MFLLEVKSNSSFGFDLSYLDDIIFNRYTVNTSLAFLSSSDTIQIQGFLSLILERKLKNGLE